MSYIYRLLVVFLAVFALNSGYGLKQANAGNWDPYPVSGEKKLLVILVEFNNVSLTSSPDDWNNAFFNYSSGVRSVANFYEDNSYGALTITPVPTSQPGYPQGIVQVNVDMDHPDCAYWGCYTVYDEIARLALAAASAAGYVDFPSLDTNGDGVFQNSELSLYMILAGGDLCVGDPRPNVRAMCAKPLTSVTADGVAVQRYALNGDEPLITGLPVHEIGHLICGLPDLYDTSGHNSGMGSYSPMASGNITWSIGTGFIPVNFDAWSRQYLGWTTPRVNGTGTVTFGPVLSSTDSTIKLINPSASTTEYFLVENRYPTGWDVGLQNKGITGGLLVQHIDITVGNSNNDGTPGSNDINRYEPDGRQGVMPATVLRAGGNTDFGPGTLPDTRLYDGTVTGLGIYDASTLAEYMTATFDIDNSMPVSAVTYPPDGFISQDIGFSCTVTGTAADNSGTGLQKVEVSFDRGATWTSTGVTDTSGSGDWSSWSCDWSAPGDGVYYIKSRATDNSGNTGFMDAGSMVTISSIAPSSSAKPAGGEYLLRQFATLSVDQTATIYYTTDGTEPTTGSAVYSSPIPVFESTVLKFFAVNGNGNVEDVNTETYVIRPSAEWTYPLGNAGQYFNCASGDGLGNICAAGSSYKFFDGNTYLGAGDILVAKFDTSGNKLWTRMFGTSAGERAFGITADQAGNIYVAGYTSGNLDGYTNAGINDLFIMKLDPDGNKLWTHQMGTSRDDKAYDVSVDASGNVYVVGVTGYNSVAGEAGLDGNISAGGDDLFIVKYDNDGNKLWTRQMGTFSSEHATGATVDEAGNAYVAGYSGTSLDGSTPNGVFVIKYDTNGNNLWTRQIEGAAGAAYFYRISLGADGHLYLAGTAGTDLDGNINIGGYDAFVAKYDTDGNKIWTRIMGTTVHDWAYGVAVSSDGVYVTGESSGDLDGWANCGLSDTFVAKYDFDGNKIWSRLFGGTSVDSGQGIIADLNGELYIAGNNYNYLDGIIPSEGGSIFVMKLDNTAPTGSVSINGGAAATNTAAVVLSLPASDTCGIREMRISNDGVFDTETWEAYSDTRSWALESGDGTKTVYVMYRDPVANESAVFSDDIKLDTITPVSSVSLQGGTYLMRQWITLSADEAADIHYTTDGTEPTAGSPVYTAPILLSGPATLKYFAVDTAGNAEAVKTESYTIDPLPLWTRQMGTASHDYGFDVSVDDSGNVYMTGSTQGDLDGNTSAGATDVFLTKYTPDGNKLWTRQIGTSMTDLGQGVAADGSGNVYVTGQTSGNLDGNANAGSTDAFIVKYDSDGNKQWSRLLGTASYEQAYGAAVDGAGNAYVAGYTRGNLDGNVSAGGNDVFLAKFDPAGNKLWTRQMGSSAYDTEKCMNIGPDGTIYIGGYTSGSLYGNPYNGGNNLFVISCDPDGNLNWASQLGSGSYDYGFSVSAAGDGVYIVGYTEGDLDGNTKAGTLAGDFFVVKFGLDGNKQWTREMGTTDIWDGAYAVHATGNGAYVAGYTEGSLGGYANTGSTDIFLSDFDTDGNLRWMKQFGSTGSEFVYGMSMSPDNYLYLTCSTNEGLDGNVSTDSGDAAIMKIDTAPPESAITAPANGAVLSGASYIITGTADDTGLSGVAGVEVSYDGGNTWYQAVGTANWSYDWPLPVDGTYTLMSRATDNPGNIGPASPGVSVLVDKTAPVSAISSPYSGANLSGTQYIITGTASDGQGSGIQRVEVSADGGVTWDVATGTVNWSYSWTLPADGSYVIMSRGVDTCGHIEAPVGGTTVTVENDPYNSYWTRQVGSTSDDWSYRSVVDNEGNVYVSGATFGDLDGYINAGGTDIFLVKFDALGNKLWTRQVGTPMEETAFGACVDVNGYVYLSGFTSGGLDGNVNAGGADIFVAKYDGSGNNVWTRQLGTPGDDYSYCAAVDLAGDVYITGTTTGGLEGNPSAGGVDVFVARYDAMGNIISTWQWGTPADDYASGVSLDVMGDVYVGGATYGGMDGNVNTGDRDIFVTKFDNLGTPLWTRQAGTPVLDETHGLATDMEGNVYVTGFTEGGLDGNVNAGAWDIFVLKYDPMGDHVWTRQIGADGFDNAIRIVVDELGDIFLAGGLPVETGNDILVMKLDGNGNTRWTKQMGTPGWDLACGLSLDIEGNVFVSGVTDGALNGNVNEGGHDFFVCRLARPGTPDTAPPMSLVTGPSDGAALSGTSYPISGTASDDEGSGLLMVEVSTNGGISWDQASGTDNWSYGWTLPADGTYTLMSRAMDNSGNVGAASPTVTVLVDNATPVSSISGPADGVALAGATCSVTGTAGDGTGVGVAAVEVSTDGGVTWNTASGTTAWSYVWTLPADGSYNVVSRAADAVGNVETPAAGVTVLVDNTAPVSAVTGPEHGDALVGAGYVIAGTADDGAGSGVQYVQVSTDGGATWNNATGAASWSYPWSLPADGIYEISCRTVDSLGNTETPSGSIAVTVENGPYNVAWSRRLATTSSDIAYGVSTDAGGSIYVTGVTAGNLDGNTSAGQSDIFLAKYDGSGAKLWTRQFGSIKQDSARCIEAGEDGGVYVSGTTQGDMSGYTNQGQSDIVVAKYDAAGTEIWTRQLGSSKRDEVQGMAVDSVGNVYLAGSTQGDLDGNVNAGSDDIFLLKYDAAGNKLWSRLIGTSDKDYAMDVCVGAAGDLYVAGYTRSDLDGNVNTGAEDVLVMKLDTEGNTLWTRLLGSAFEDYACGMAVDGSGNVYTAGYTLGDLDGNLNTGLEDIFVVKYDPSGTRLWTSQTGTVYDDYAIGVAVDDFGKIYVAGYTTGGLHGNSNQGYEDIFVMKLDEDTRLWTRQTGTVLSDSANCVSVFGIGNVYVTGSTTGDLEGNANLGLEDAFLMKLSW